jgi:hypothetical protein
MWSKRNVALAEKLIAEGRMHSAGLAELERQSIRDPLQNDDGEATGDASGEDRAIRRHAGPRRDHLSAKTRRLA